MTIYICSIPNQENGKNGCHFKHVGHKDIIFDVHVLEVHVMELDIIHEFHLDAVTELFSVHTGAHTKS